MKRVRFLFVVVLLLQAVFVFAQNGNAKVISIDHSDFVSEIYPKMKRPLIILFGSNYCGYSRNQIKLLNKVI